MASTSFKVNDPLAVKIWSKMLAAEAYRQTYIGRFIGEGRDALIQEKTELRKSAGDRITCGLRLQLNGDGVEGDATVEGGEEAMQFFDDSLLINQLRHAVQIAGRMTEQRVHPNLRNEAKDALGDWWAQRMDTAFFNQICGNTVETRSVYTGHNATSAPTGNRHIWQGGHSDDQSITSSDTFTLELVDIARQRAETASTADGTGPVIRPIRYKGQNLYVMFIHDYQVHSLRTNSDPGEWKDIQMAAMMGGDVEKNPIFTDALGMYNGVVLHKASRVTTGVNSSTGAAVSTVRRAVLCGAQSATIAFGADNGPTKFTWVEEAKDYGNKYGVLAGAIWGLKKTKFVPADDSATNAEDFGTVVVSTYGAPATTS